MTLLDERSNAPERKNQNGGVVKGFVYDIATGQTIKGAKVSARWERAPKEGEGELPSVDVDASGAYRLEGLPAGRFYIVASAPGYASRRLATVFHNRNRSLRGEVIHLSRKTTVAGQVKDSDGKPVSSAQVSIREMQGIDGRGYIIPDLGSFTTGTDGRFKFDGVPEGFLQLRTRKSGLHQTSFVFESHESPAKSLQLGMAGTGSVRGTIQWDGRVRPHAHLFPVDGETIGRWSGSMRCKPDGSFEFKNVPAGEYRVSLHSSGVLKSQGVFEQAAKIIVRPGKEVVVEVK